MRMRNDKKNICASLHKWNDKYAFVVPYFIYSALFKDKSDRTIIGERKNPDLIRTSSSGKGPGWSRIQGWPGTKDDSWLYRGDTNILSSLFLCCSSCLCLFHCRQSSFFFLSLQQYDMMNIGVGQELKGLSALSALWWKDKKCQCHRKLPQLRWCSFLWTLVSFLTRFGWIGRESMNSVLKHQGDSGKFSPSKVLQGGRSLCHWGQLLPCANYSEKCS